MQNILIRNVPELYHQKLLTYAKQHSLTLNDTLLHIIVHYFNSEQIIKYSNDVFIDETILKEIIEQNTIIMEMLVEKLSEV